MDEGDQVRGHQGRVIRATPAPKQLLDTEHLDFNARDLPDDPSGGEIEQIGFLKGGAVGGGGLRISPGSRSRCTHRKTGRRRRYCFRSSRAPVRALASQSPDHSVASFPRSNAAREGGIACNRLGTSNEIALNLTTAFLHQEFTLALGLDTFRNDRHAKRVA